MIKKLKNQQLKMFKIFVKYASLTAAGLLTVWDQLCYEARVDGSSMQPVINQNSKVKEHVFVMRLFSPLNLFAKKPLVEDMLKRGDVVSLISPKNPNETFVKRIIGMPGDLVKTIHYRKKYVVVPQGHCWIEGDNYEKSYDSNNFGCVPLNLIIGKVKFILYPRLSVLENNYPNHRILSVLKEDKNKFFIDFKSKKEDQNKNNDDEDDSYEDDD